MLARIRSFVERLRTWLSPGRVEEEFSRELHSHLEMLEEENMRRGMEPEEARRAARIRLGGMAQLEEVNRELRGLPILKEVFSDARYGFRSLRKNPGFTAVAVLTLALGVGANTAIFSVVNAVLLKPLPYPNSEQLFFVFHERERDATEQAAWSYPSFEELRRQNHVFSEAAGFGHHQLTLTGRGEPAQVGASPVTPELFSMFGTKPLAGRVFVPADGIPGAAPVVILSESMWRGRFRGDPQAVGSSIQLDQRSFTVVGIMPQDFRFPVLTNTEQIWIPMAQDPLFGPWMPGRERKWLPVICRLKPGVSVKQAHAELDAIDARLAKEFPGEESGWVIRLVPLQEGIVENVRPALLVLSGAVVLVLLIACANVASLLLARATTRSREIAVRTTLGAGRARIVRQLLSETAVLGGLGGAAGIALAYWGVHALGGLLPANLPRVNPIRVDSGVLSFALALSAIASFVFGLAPAVFAVKSGIETSLREGGGRAGESPASRRARSILAAGETALAMVLLVAAGLLLRSYTKLTTVNPGFSAEHVLKANIALPRSQYTTPQQWLTFLQELLARIQAEPGLKDSALAVPTPIADGCVTLGFDIVGSPSLTSGTSRTANYVAVSPEYFRVMGIPLVSGRAFDERDAMSTPRVALISQAMARIYFSNQNPLGQRLSFAFPPASEESREIVGIVGDVRDEAPGTDPGPMMYVPFAQAPFAGSDVVVRSTLDASLVVAGIRRALAQVDKNLTVSDVAQLPDAIESSLAQPRFRTLLLALFAGIALMLAATGIFGVISYSVSRRTQEIGIRVALGASRGMILRMVLGETLGLALAGVALGVPSALLAARLLGHMLFGVSASDPATLAAVAFALVAAAVLAGYVPVRRAMQVDPLEALRHE
ncbi:MAG TPA: ABC transporter permease [Candidatus Acidoferrales bacterium]|nr:ABC transporter permease [Candidatus Acidoferrales bacterium]